MVKSNSSAQPSPGSSPGGRGIEYGLHGGIELELFDLEIDVEDPLRREKIGVLDRQITESRGEGSTELLRRSPP